MTHVQRFVPSFTDCYSSGCVAWLVRFKDRGGNVFIYMDFGAVGDGYFTKDTEAIKKAIASVKLVQGRAWYSSQAYILLHLSTSRHTAQCLSRKKVILGSMDKALANDSPFAVVW